MYLIPIEQLVLPLACRGMKLKMTHRISRWPDTQEWLRLWCRCSTGQLCTLTEQNFTDHALSVKLRGLN